MIDHVTLDVSSHPTSRSFYERALAPLGWSIVAEWPGGCGFGMTRGGPTFWLRQDGRPSSPIHLAFRAGSRAAVHAFHEQALLWGGRANGEPGLRDYHDDYYGAFILDPDGHNVEAVCHEAPGPATGPGASSADDHDASSADDAGDDPADDDDASEHDE